MSQWLTIFPDETTPSHQPCRSLPPSRHCSSDMWPGLPVQLSSRPPGHTNEASRADEAWFLPQTESVRGDFIE